jgi:hypothetical protein
MLNHANDPISERGTQRRGTLYQILVPVVAPESNCLRGTRASLIFLFKEPFCPLFTLINALLHITCVQAGAHYQFFSQVPTCAQSKEVAAAKHKSFKGS